MSESGTAAKKESARKTVKKVTTKGSDEASLNMSELRELAELVDKHGFTDFEFENEKIRIRLSKQTTAPQIVQAVAPVANHPVAPVVHTAPPKVETPHPGAKAETEASHDEDLFKITSPIVGTFYSSPAPDKPAYVSVGDKVNEATVVCIVEAMKLMNEIQAEVAGEVIKVYVENGQPVEYGQPLFGIKK
ncbi:MAG: acetyl-CoA carboxylase biotin carboxyl carrier protein [Pyrinomonadaceae bacterium]|nr:acetyl-CoA carboxylase biotin carboxyl carrier protein [Pyrinomonadaceae bacterium]